MAIKKARANYDTNGTGSYDTFHYETQVKQVKVVDSTGKVTGDLETELVNIGHDIDAVDAKVDNNKVSITNLENKVGTATTLTTTAKTVIPAINELKSKADTNAKDISSLGTRMTTAENDIKSHNHDSIYLKLIGGNVTGNISMANSKAFKGKNTSGVDLNLAYIDGSNQSRFGDTSAKSIINALNADLKVYDGTSSHKVFHAGNMGANSGLDADMLDGIQGSSFARRDAGNTFTGDQTVGEGKSINLKATNGSSQAGSLFFRDGDGVQKGRVLVDIGGNMNLYGGTTKGLTIKSNGDTETTHDHILNAKERQVAIRFKLDDNDKGAGFYMNNTSKQVGFYDWKTDGWMFTTDRNDQVVKFTNEIAIQGHKLYIQYTEPTSGMKEGDIWINIDK